jgi:hypothetical protein
VLVEVGFRAFSPDEKIEKDGQVLEAGKSFLKGVCPDLFIADGLKDLLCGFRVVPEIRGSGEFFFFCYEGKFAVDVKETSSRRRALTGDS